SRIVCSPPSTHRSERRRHRFLEECREMNYFGLIRGAALAGIAGLALVAGSAQAQTVWRINVSMPQDGHHGIAIDTFAEEVERLTEGRYVIDTFYAGSLGGERESIEG